MNEQTLKLIEDLAKKIGTTSEYLWAILIKQAPIEAYINIGYAILILSVGYILWNVHLKLLSKPPGDRYDTYYEKHDGVSVIIISIVAIVWLICLIAALSSVGNILTCFYNPEYWALDRILDSIKPSK